VVSFTSEVDVQQCLWKIGFLADGWAARYEAMDSDADEHEVFVSVNSSSSEGCEMRWISGMKVQRQSMSLMCSVILYWEKPEHCT